MIEKSTCKAMQKVFSTLFEKFSGQTSSIGSKIDVDDFDNFFVQVGLSLATDIPCNFTTADIEANEKYFFCPTDESEVSIVREKLKNKTSVGHDGINNRMVKFCAPIILPFLIFCFIQCFNSGVFPDICKIAKVLPIYKTGKPTKRVER